MVSAVTAGQSSPSGSVAPPRCRQYLVAGGGSGGVGLPCFGFLAGWDDRRGTAGGDGVVALACVEGAVAVSQSHAVLALSWSSFLDRRSVSILGPF